MIGHGELWNTNIVCRIQHHSLGSHGFGHSRNVAGSACWNRGCLLFTGFVVVSLDMTTPPSNIDDVVSLQTPKLWLLFVKYKNMDVPPLQPSADPDYPEEQLRSRAVKSHPQPHHLSL